MLPDYRDLIEPESPSMCHPKHNNPDMRAPPEPGWLRSELASHSAKHGVEARYSLIRLKSAPDYWPTKMDEESASNTAFLDPSGRVWEWVTHRPRDIPYESWWVHDALHSIITDPPQYGSERRDPDEECVDNHVRRGVETYLIMGRNGKEAKYWTLWCMVSHRPCLLAMEGKGRDGGSDEVKANEHICSP